MGSDDGTFDEEFELASEGGSLADAKGFQKGFEELIDPGLVSDGNLVGLRVLPRELGDGLDEGTAIEVRGTEPLGMPIEDGHQALHRIVTGGFDSGEEGALELGGAALEDGDDEVVLRGEVIVEGHLRDAGLGEDGVDADGVEAVAIEEPPGGIEKDFAFG